MIVIIQRENIATRSLPIREKAQDPNQFGPPAVIMDVNVSSLALAHAHAHTLSLTSKGANLRSNKRLPLIRGAQNGPNKNVAELSATQVAQGQVNKLTPGPLKFFFPSGDSCFRYRRPGGPHSTVDSILASNQRPRVQMKF